MGMIFAVGAGFSRAAVQKKNNRAKAQRRKGRVKGTKDAGFDEPLEEAILLKSIPQRDLHNR